jgi:hypothetical protein
LIFSDCFISEEAVEKHYKDQYCNTYDWMKEANGFMERLRNMGSTFPFMSLSILDYGSGSGLLNKKEIARANISLSDIGGFVIPKPLEKVQEQIVQSIKTIDEKIELHTAKKSTLQDLFKSMLNKLMTGEIRVKNLDIDIFKVSA